MCTTSKQLYDLAHSQELAKADMTEVVRQLEQWASVEIREPA
jgi:hypothetical protein